MANDPQDEAAIIALIHRNRIAIWTRDYATWEKCFVHASYTRRVGWARRGGMFRHIGWDDINDRVRKLGLPRQLDYAYETQVDNLVLRIEGNMAWAAFDQIYPGTIAGHIGPGVVHEARVFEKHEGEWKIAFLTFLDPNAGSAGMLAMQIDPSGSVLWKSPGADAALSESDDLVVRAGRLCFRNTRADRRLRDYLRWAAEADLDFHSGRQSKPIVVDVGEGEAPRIYWIVVDGRTILFHIGSTEISAEQLDLAAAIYDLSPSQKRLAGLVAEGLSLAQIAARMEITANTARTHLNRVYEKIGVRTQPALVRVLLSTISPV